MKGLYALFSRTGTRPSRTRTLPAPSPKPLLASPSQTFAEVVRRGRTMATPGNSGSGRGGRGYDARYDPGFQPGFNPGVVAAVVDEVLFPIVVAADSVDTTTKAQGIAVSTSMVAQELMEEIEGTVGAGVEGDGRTLPTQTLITCLLTFLMEATARQTAIGNWHTQAISLLLGCLTKGVSTRMYTVFRDLMKPGS